MHSLLSAPHVGLKMGYINGSQWLRGAAVAASRYSSPARPRGEPGSTMPPPAKRQLCDVSAKLRQSPPLDGARVSGGGRGAGDKEQSPRADGRGQACAPVVARARDERLRRDVRRPLRRREAGRHAAVAGGLGLRGLGLLGEPLAPELLRRVVLRRAAQPVQRHPLPAAPPGGSGAEHCRDQPKSRGEPASTIKKLCSLRGQQRPPWGCSLVRVSRWETPPTNGSHKPPRVHG